MFPSFAPETPCGSLYRRALHSSSSSQANVLSASALPPDGLTATPIFDIFDAPVRLGESRPSTYDRPFPLIKKRALVTRPHHTPSSLPAPILFDGPACPQNLPQSLRVKRNARFRSHAALCSSTPFFVHSQPQIELFDGPARITRCSSRPPVKHGASPRHLLLLGIAGAACGAVKLTNSSTIGGRREDPLDNGRLDAVPF